MNSSDIPCPPERPGSSGSAKITLSLDALLSNLPGMVYRCRNDSAWTMEFVSARVQELTGYPAQALLDEGSARYTGLIHPDDLNGLQHEVHAALAEGRPFQVTYRITTADGAQKWVWEQGAAVYDDAGKVQALEGFICDITRRKETETMLIESEARFCRQASLLDKAQDAIIVRDLNHRVLYWNKTAERLYGWTADEAIGQPIDQMIYRDIASYSEADKTVLAFGEWSGDIMQRRKGGSLLPVEAHCTLVVDDEGKPTSVLSINTDITQRKAAETKIQHLAFYDTLTRLPNRVYFLERLQHAPANSSRSRHSGALMFIDLDNFKTLNDTLGHDKGDLLPGQVAQRLASCMREGDTVARLGSDEFMILLEELSESIDIAVIQAKNAGEKILSVFKQPYCLGSYVHYSSPSIGVTMFKGHEDTLDEILKRADLAMYQAKAAGRNTLHFFDPQMQAALKDRGVAFSVDDFGTGYSSLSYLKCLPLDYLKIDQSFVWNVLIDANDTTIACTIVALGRTLGLQVIAEGMETEAQQDFLALHGCHTYQGYLFNRPLPIDEFDAFVQEKNRIGIRKSVLADGAHGERSPDAVRHSG